MLGKLAAAGALTVALVGASLGMSSGTGSACVGNSVDSAAVAGKTLDGYTGEQLTNAAAIMNAATTLGLGQNAQTIGVMTAMGESGLRILDHGDQAGPDSRGLFQQRDSWGSLADRMDPTKSALLFFNRLKTVQGWETMTPSAAAHAVQVNADPNHYTKWFSPATDVVQQLGGASQASCSVSGDAKQLAQELVDAAAAGKFVTLHYAGQPDHMPEIRNIAEGKSIPNCGIDVGVLQIMVVAVHTFQKVGVSDINRKCTGQIEGAGTESAHYKDGGGHAVDFYMLNGASLTGADGNSLRIISVLDPLVPKGARIGQKDVRTSAGIRLSLANLTEFDDTPDHLHVDLINAKGKTLTSLGDTQ